MKLYKIFTLLLVLILATSSAAFGADAVIKNFTGRVEIQSSGSTAWSAVSQGQIIKTGTLISTGFNSNAVLDLGSSEIFLKPLTRVSVDELDTSGSTIKTDLNLRLGKIRADVKTTEGLKHNFTLRTPVSTAAVRGTVFEAGVSSLDVIEGMIAYSNKIGQRRSVGGGSSSSMPGTGFSSPESALEAIAASFGIDTTTAFETGAGIVSDYLGVKIRTTGDGTVVVTLINSGT
ncbi:MAG: FecR domain-containing protein [Spirochaetia bacterium]|jgi:hypothetical protein|nr:FecR domain-containing protein [Spirochaetia bacterium]